MALGLLTLCLKTIRFYHFCVNTGIPGSTSQTPGFLAINPSTLNLNKYPQKNQNPRVNPGGLSSQLMAHFNFNEAPLDLNYFFSPFTTLSAANFPVISETGKPEGL
jgi:hypothetical protein